MTSARLRTTSWRYYRNWIIFMLMWVLLFVFVVRAWQASNPLAVILIGALPTYWVGSAIYYAFRYTHPRVRFRLRTLTPADAGLDCEQVEFPSRDGLILSGWYIPGERQAVIILVHGFGSDGMSMIYHASVMAAHGYGALLLDLRAHGQSQGDTCTWGWRETNDLLGAADYLTGRGDVDSGKIGVLGISLGGQVALRGAARSTVFRGAVVEGPSAATLADREGRPITWRGWLNYPAAWLYYHVARFMNGARPTHGVLEDVKEIAPRPLLVITAGAGPEQRFGQRVWEAAGEPKELWEIPEAQHGGCYFARPDEYTVKIGAFFQAAFDLRDGGIRTRRGA